MNAHFLDFLPETPSRAGPLIIETLGQSARGECRGEGAGVEVRVCERERKGMLLYV